MLKGTERAPALSADHITFSLDEYECVIGRKRERESETEREVCVCVLNPRTKRHAGKSFEIEVSDQVYMFSRGAGCPCNY